jgi:enoyl-CoA hydratase
MRQIKKSVRYGIQMELRTAFRFEVEACNPLVGTEDRREGVAAFNEKTSPFSRGAENTDQMVDPL